MLRAAADQFAQEDDLLARLPYGDVVVADAAERLLHLVQFVVVGGKQGLGMSLVLVDILHDGPCDGDAVVGGGASAQFVEQHQTALREVVQYGGGLVHLHHEGTLAGRDVVGGAHAGEYLVHDADGGAFCRHEGAYLRHEHDEGGLPEQGRLTGHIGTCQHDNLLRVVVEQDVVGHIRLADRQLLLDDRVASLTDVDDERVVHLGADVAVLQGCPCEAEQAV